jgi:hypothetical protein
MIQGCRYLRRSTDRWTLSKNSTTRLKDSRVWRKAGLLCECFDYNYIHPGFIFIPCRGMTSSGLRAQYLIPILSPSANAYPSIRPFRSGHVTTQSREIIANSPFVERKQLPTANSSAESFWRNLPSSGRIFLPSWAHKSDSLLYQILVLTYAPSITG